MALGLNDVGTSVGWSNSKKKGSIIDPRNGRVKGRLDLSSIIPSVSDPEAVLNGTAYDPERNRLLVTGKLWPRLYEISIPSLGIGGGAAEPNPAP